MTIRDRKEQRLERQVARTRVRRIDQGLTNFELDLPVMEIKLSDFARWQDLDSMVSRSGGKEETVQWLDT